MRFFLRLTILMALALPQSRGATALPGEYVPPETSRTALDLICLRDSNALYRVFILNEELPVWKSDNTSYSATVIENPDRSSEKKYLLHEREFSLRPATSNPKPSGYFFFDKVSAFELRCKVNGGYHGGAAMTIGN